MGSMGIHKCCYQRNSNKKIQFYIINRYLWKWSQNNDLRGVRVWYPKINSQEDANKFVTTLDVKGRNFLLDELNLHQSIDPANISLSAMQPVKFNQLLKIFVVNSLPYIGFGILDNGIMIVAGEYIDMTLGVMLGISTMAAAALGNLISDLAGICTAGYIETFVERLGLVAPRLTEAQAKFSSARYMPFLGRFIGLGLGCLLGMLPLLFFDEKEESDNKDKKNNSKKESSVDKIETSVSIQK